MSKVRTPSLNGSKTRPKKVELLPRKVKVRDSHGEIDWEAFFGEGQADPSLLYPGSKRPRRTEYAMRPEPVLLGTDAWREDFVLRRIGGVERKTYTIGALSQATGRPLITIRKWIATGRIPMAPYRLPDRGKQPGPRLYTEPMIDALLDLLEVYEVRNRKRIEWDLIPQFIITLSEEWKKIYRRETGADPDVPSSEDDYLREPARKAMNFPQPSAG